MVGPTGQPRRGRDHSVRLRFPINRSGAVRVLAGILCLPVLYLTARGTLPYLEPVLQKAALLSAELSFLPKEETAQALAGSVSDGELNALAGAIDTELDPTGPEEGEQEPASSEPPAETSSEEQPQETLVKPENAGVVQRKTYAEGNTAVYIPTGEGYIKNCTSLPASQISETVQNLPKFKVKADGEPEVLIMHTHATESYQPQELDWYDKSYNSRTTDLSRNTCRVGDEIQAQLEAAGIGVLHDKTLHDYPSYNGAYERSAVTVKQYLKDYPSIKVVLDVHRDAIQPDANTMVAPVVEIDGKSCAQVMIISGADNGKLNMPNYLENLKFSAALQRTMAADYPGLARPILFDYRKYNQDLTTGSILLEMGGHANSLDEAVYCGELVGKSLAKTLLELR